MASNSNRRSVRLRSQSKRNLNCSQCDDHQESNSKHQNAKKSGGQTRQKTLPKTNRNVKKNGKLATVKIKKGNAAEKEINDNHQVEDCDLKPSKSVNKHVKEKESFKIRECVVLLPLPKIQDGDKTESLKKKKQPLTVTKNATEKPPTNSKTSLKNQYELKTAVRKSRRSKTNLAINDGERQSEENDDKPVMKVFLEKMKITSYDPLNTDEVEEKHITANETITTKQKIQPTLKRALPKTKLRQNKAQKNNENVDNSLEKKSEVKTTSYDSFKEDEVEKKLTIANETTKQEMQPTLKKSLPETRLRENKAKMDNKKMNSSLEKNTEVKTTNCDSFNVDKIEGQNTTVSQVVPNRQKIHPNLKKSLPKTRFRERKILNYAESSLELSTEVETKNENTNKLPIYKQKACDETKLKKHEDLYEFDSDSEKKKKRKLRKRKDSSSDEYNNTIRNILKNVMTKVKKRNKKVVFCDKENKGKIQTVKSAASVKSNNLQTKPVKAEITNSAKLQERVNMETIKSQELYQNNDEDNIEDVNDRDEDNIEDVNDRDEDNIEDVNDRDDDNQYFGFDAVEDAKENTSKIKIISNIQLQPNKQLNLIVGTPAKFKEGKPKANSTMLNNVLTPWRFNEMNITRNPHFITLKESALPCISQDMVLDHTVVDKFDSVSKTPFANRENDYSYKKVPVQREVTDFFQKCNEDKENTSVSLFDNDQFISPIKNYNQFGNRVDSVKRRILGEKIDNVINQVQTSTPNRMVPKSPIVSVPSSEELDNDFTNFGFDESEENIPDISNRPKNNKPFRVSMNDKKYQHKKKLKKVEPVWSVDPSDDESDVSELTDTENHSGEIKLFEDFYEIEDNKPVVTKKKSKWQKDENDGPKPKKRKEMRTKKEEEEAEKWAAAFNSMCEEIEDFPLEIE